jgi:formylglycine-generating enzyme required for sulfatase activity
MYFRSYDFLGDPASGDTNHPAKVSSFRFDKYEVTVGRFRTFVQAGMGTQFRPPVVGAGAHPNIPGSGWDLSWNAILVTDKDALINALRCDPMFQTWTENPGANEERPINCITWYEAMAFCIWDGGYLPTEAEWNYAAAGGDEQRLYPWSKPANSTTIDGLHASYNYGDGTNCTGDGMAGCAFTDLVAAGTKPDGAARWGQLDLAGNVGEWVLDASGSYVDPCVDCAKLTMGSSRGVRGGSFYFDVTLARAGFRYGGTATSRNASFGVRCSRAI